MCAALTGAEAVKSKLVPINTPGSTGQFEIAQGKMLYMYQCSTATYQPCKSFPTASYAHSLLFINSLGRDTVHPHGRSVSTVYRLQLERTGDFLLPVAR